jgi:hypothetical protein
MDGLSRHGLRSGANIRGHWGLAICGGVARRQAGAGRFRRGSRDALGCANRRRAPHLEGGTAPVAFSPDERWVFTGGANHAAILWDAQSGSLVRTFDGHTDTLTGVVFPADGRRVLTGSREGTARLWDAQTGQGIHTLTHTNPVVSVAFSPDGRQVLTGEEDGPPRLWQADTGQLERVMAGLVGPVAFGYDSEVVVVGVPLIFYQSLRAQDAGRAKVKDGVKDGSRVAVAAAPRTSSPAAGRLARWGRWARDSDGLGAAIGGRSRSGNVPSRRCPGGGGAREDALISCGCRGICRGMKDRLAVTEDKIWDRVIRPEIGDLHRAAARELLRLHLAAEDARRVEELSNKANAGTLRADEEQELDHYLNVGRALEFLKAKARVSLRETSAPA